VRSQRLSPDVSERGAKAVRSSVAFYGRYVALALRKGAVPKRVTEGPLHVRVPNPGSGVTPGHVAKDLRQ
jgi:hypothetical protein